MTDTDALGHVLDVIASAKGSMALVRKNDRLLLALPADREAAGRTLHLYQPQRRVARFLVDLLEVAVAAGIHRWILQACKTGHGQVTLEPPLPVVIAGTCGVMLGSPEHPVRRAIASFKTANGWEVAKVAFGAAGWEVIHGEVAALRSLPENTSGAPTVLGVHRGPDISLMRMPYFQGSVLRQGDSAEAITVLESWKLDLPAKPITEFPEWPAIEAALSKNGQGRAALARLTQRQLFPVIRHGDFARWNLLRTANGKLMVLDWEWGVATGMPGIDLVHFFAQDARLVRCLPPKEVIRVVEKSLQDLQCRRYLDMTGWQGDIHSAMLASIAFTVGAKQQANEEILAALLHRV